MLISGTVGSGKTTIGGEIADTLAERKIPSAFIDLDALAFQWPPSSKWNNDLLFENLASIWPNYAEHATTHLVLAHVLEDPDDLPRYREAIPGIEITVCRLIADEEVRKERLRRRMPPGGGLDWHLNRTVELHDILEAAKFEDFVVVNDDRPVRQVALEVLEKAGWL